MLCLTLFSRVPDTRFPKWLYSTHDRTAQELTEKFREKEDKYLESDLESHVSVLYLVAT